MKASQIAWLTALAAFVSTALIGQAELLGEPWRHVVSILAIVATAISGFMVQHPWDGQTDRRASSSPTYIVIREGVGRKVTQAGVEAALKGAALDLPQPLPPAA
jgi:predicted aspartyl protease